MLFLYTVGNYFKIKEKNINNFIKILTCSCALGLMIGDCEGEHEFKNYHGTTVPWTIFFDHVKRIEGLLGTQADKNTINKSLMEGTNEMYRYIKADIEEERRSRFEALWEEKIREELVDKLGLVFINTSILNKNIKKNS